MYNLGRCFARCPPQLVTNKKMVKGYVSALLECLNHADGGVREAASEALGALMKILGEPTLTKLMPDLDAIKMAKVKEYCDKTVLTGKMPKIAPEEKPNSGPKVLKSFSHVSQLKPHFFLSVVKLISPKLATSPHFFFQF